MKPAAIALITALIVLMCITIPQAQEVEGQPRLRVYLSEDSTSYAGLITVNQIWTRYIQNNPDNFGTAQYPDYDIGIRRSRMMLYASLMDKVFLYTQLGYDGATYRRTEDKGIRLFDARTEYRVAPEKLYLGVGLHSWNGISRYASSHFAKLLVVDVPGFTYPVRGAIGEPRSQLGVYARGCLNRLQYRISLVKPFEQGIDSVSSPVTTERINENFAVKGYFSWQFFDRESSMLPYMTMNNLGRGKLLNVGAGFYYHPQAMLVEAEKDVSTVDPMLAGMLIMAGNYELLNALAGYFPSEVSDVFLSAADVFVDLPGRRNSAVTAYAGYFYQFFGAGYLRSAGSMQVAGQSPVDGLPQGVGNSQWETGTGHILRGEFGYLLPGGLRKNRLQPYGAFTWKKFEALDEASLQFDAGMNWLLHRHNIKWTLQYSSRPVYRGVENRQVIDQYKGQVILQSQVYF